MTANRLNEETSPYLLQHADNPVHWQAWSTETLALAKAEDKPILLSIGYAACHWCHVMAHESFENQATADLMNDLFVNIKVDREERPDLDAIYQHALALLGEQGGWPLTMFLTPAGEPFWGGTYFPPESRWGRPGFPTVLSNIAAAYRRDPEKISQNVQAIQQALDRLSTPKAGSGVAIELIDEIARRFLKEIDLAHGGIGGAPKFPQPGILELLWRGWKRLGDTAMRDAVLLSLDHMSQGGIYDHLGGGYARYATDQRWLVPHFEKMLYDNAQLIDLLTTASQETGRPLYAERIRETIGWIEREMTTPDGAFSSSLDADSEHEEGKFYIWTEEEIDRLLGDRSPLFKEFYDVTPGGNWEGHTILNRLVRPEDPDAATSTALAACRAILFQAREPRVHPGLDDKVLADWNGLMIAALARTGAVFDRPDWTEKANRAYDFILQEMMDADGRLSHSWRAGRKRHPATLDDYANLTRAALTLAEVLGERRYIDQAKQWIAIANRHYWDSESGGYFFTADDTEGLVARTKTAQDAAVPAGNGTLIDCLTRLYHFTGKEEYRDRAAAIASAFGGEPQRNFFGLSTYLNSCETAQRALQVIILGRRGEAGTDALVRAVMDLSLPTLILSVIPSETELPENHPAAGKTQVGGKPTAYICEGPVCSLPVTEPPALTQALRKR